MTDNTGDIDFESLDGYGWVTLLIDNPQLADRCVWENFDADAWVRILIFHPEFKDRCDWSKLSDQQRHDVKELQEVFSFWPELAQEARDRLLEG